MSQKKIKSLSEKVVDVLLHPHGEQSSEDESVEEDTPKIEEFNKDDYELPDDRATDIRKKNVRMLSEQSSKYRGKIASRRDFEYEESDLSEEDDRHGVGIDLNDDDDRAPIKKFSMRLKAPSSDDEYNATSSDDENEEVRSSVAQSNDDSDCSDGSYFSYKGSSSNENDDDSDSESSDDEQAEEESTNLLANKNRHADVEKGICVQNQLNLWERFLEMRIHSQKFLSKANHLPAPSSLQDELNQDKELQRSSQELQQNVGHLLNGLLELKSSLYAQYPEIKSFFKDKRKTSTLKRSDGSPAPPSKYFAQYLEDDHKDFKPYRNAVLLKWDDRTKLLTPRSFGKKNKQSEEYNIVRKIENALHNKNALIEKSQTHQDGGVSSQLSVDQNDQKDEAPNTSESKAAYIYDDTDFYHEQLRELIEYKANFSSNAADITKQLIELQKIRQKMKKKVDTRASKGRKTRYTVHKKLVNFMAPIDDSNWTEESKNELYKSLFV